MALALAKRTLVIKAESTAGTSVISGMADADFDILFRDVKYSKEISEYAIKVANGNHDKERSIMGQRKGTITGFVDIRYSGADATEPNLGKLQAACGLLASSPSSNQVYSPDKSLDISCVSALIQEEYLGGSAPLALGIQFKGCMGNAKFVSDKIGDAVRYEFELQGVFIGVANIANNAILELTGADTAQPDHTLSSIVSLGGNTKLFEKFELDQGNKIEFLSDSGDSDGAGLRHAYIMDRDPRITVDPKASLTTEDDDHASWIAGTELVLSFTTTNYTIAANKCQILSLGDADSGGLVVNELVMRPNKDTSYPYTITHANIP